MTRKKVVLERIPNEAARKATYKKRKKGLIKKVSELSTLCGINACAVIYSPYEPHPEIWPPSPAAVHRVLTRFKEIPRMEQRKKMLNHEGFLSQRITKANHQLRKMRKDNREKEMTHIMYQCLTGKELLQTLDLVDLNDLGWVIDQTVREIDRRVEKLRAETQQLHVPSPRDGTPAAGDVAAIPGQLWHMNYALPAQMDWNIGLSVSGTIDPVFNNVG